MSRVASSLRSTIPAIAILVIAVFCSLELAGKPSDPLPNPPELRAKNHTLSLINWRLPTAMLSRANHTKGV
jgi:hypothetical protein